MSVLGLVLFVAVLMRSRRCTGIRPNNFVFLVFLRPWLLGLTFVLDRRARSPSRELLVALPACECSSSFAATPPAPLPPVLNTRQDLQGSPLHTHEATAASHRVRHALVGARTIVHFVFCHRGSGVPCLRYVLSDRCETRGVDVRTPVDVGDVTPPHKQQQQHRFEILLVHGVVFNSVSVLLPAGCLSILGGRAR